VVDASLLFEISTAIVFAEISRNYSCQFQSFESMSFRKLLKCIHCFTYCKILYCFHFTELEIYLSASFLCVSLDLGWIVQIFTLIFIVTVRVLSSGV
jgi:hypothetical protein